MVRKGLSWAEKRDRMLAVFHQTVHTVLTQKEAYNFKEIEKFSIKQSIPLPVVKDVLDSLVGDDLVIVEKIGAGNYFWSFPSQTYQTVASCDGGGQQDRAAGSERQETGGGDRRAAWAARREAKGQGGDEGAHAAGGSLIGAGQGDRSDGRGAQGAAAQ